MNRKEVIKKAISYSKDGNNQRCYIAGFQEACNHVRKKLEKCYYEEFCDEMEKLSEIAYVDFDEELEGQIKD